MTLAELLRSFVADSDWKMDQDASGKLSITLGLERSRKQTIEVECITWDGVPMARFRSVIGDDSALTGERPKFALSLNGGLILGALAVVDRHLVLTHTLHLDGLVAAEAMNTIRYLANKADELERMIFGQDRR